MRWSFPSEARWLRRWTIRLGVATVLVFAFPAITVLCLISIVGIPLGIVLMLTPFTFTVIALAFIIQKLHGRDGRAALAASIGLALLLLAGVAQFANARLDRRADAFLAGDLDTLERPLRAKSIGLANFGFTGWSKKESRCGELCQRLLLSGAADRVIVADRAQQDGEAASDSASDSAGRPSPATTALSYRLEVRESCPDVHLAGERSGQPVDDAKPEEAMRLSIVSGRCLLEEPATLGEADAVIVTGRVQRGSSDFSAGLSLLADTVTADRASVYLREQDAFKERYRSTGVTVLHHPLLPLPTLVGGHELNMQPGFLRNDDKRNVRDFAKGGVDAIRFLQVELGVNVSLAAAATGIERNALIARGLDEGGTLRPGLQQVIEDFFESLRDAKEIDDATRLLAFRALADPRVDAPRLTWALTRAVAKAGDAVNVELAAILFARLMTTDPALRENHPSYLGWPAAYLAHAIATLPPQAILAHRAELEQLARNPARRRRAHPALVRLSVFGAEAAPTLLYLVDQGLALKQAAGTSRSSSKSQDTEEWQEPYRSGLAGLCRLGSEASSMLAPLFTRLRDGAISIDGPGEELLLNTLLQLGAGPEELRGLYVRDELPETLSNFERLVTRAQSRPECIF